MAVWFPGRREWMRRAHERQILVPLEKYLPRNRNAPDSPQFQPLSVRGLEKPLRRTKALLYFLLFTPDFGGKSMSPTSGTNSICLTKLEGLSVAQ